MMRLHSLIMALTVGSTYGEDSGVAQAHPKTFFNIVAAIEQSELPCLTTNSDADGTTYHLRGVNYLGQVRRDHRLFSVAQISFVRSSPPGRDTPPPRGHGFVILLDQSFRVVACGPSDHGFLHMSGSKLMEGQTEVADFESEDLTVRCFGFCNLNMPYPFADRITEGEWNSGRSMPSETSSQSKTEQAAPSDGEKPAK